ncbi:MAG TPA: flagellar hook capping FlgD N-terminal domain-containing protein [Alphaproteobacteria bacterium]|nr:flagellar hook capping FlgD N-terminal domain-containing protein [Alphaproteobacteria bacterium]
MASITQLSTATDLSGLSGTKVSSSSSSADTSSTDSAAKKADELKNQFLSILLTQMQHQNPLDPMDTKEFTGQLAQFSSLEQQISTNVKLDDLLSSLQQTAVSSAFGYIGQYVDLDTPTSTMQDGSATWTYALPEDAESVTIKIKDGSGNILYSGTMQNNSGSTEMGAGTYSFGITNADLTKAVNDGEVLTMSVSATNSQNTPITADIHTTVKVDSIQSDAAGTYLQAGGILFEISDVQKIVNKTQTSTDGSGTDTTTEQTTA